MNPAFFQQVETALAPERLDAYRQDGAVVEPRGTRQIRRRRTHKAQRGPRQHALSRSLSPAMVAEYETMLPDKNLLKAKLHELYLLLAPSEDADTVAASPKPKRKTKGAQP